MILLNDIGHNKAWREVWHNVHNKTKHRAREKVWNMSGNKILDVIRNNIRKEMDGNT